MKIEYIDIDLIKEAKINSNIVPDNIFKKLKQDIAENGVMYPVVVYKDGDGKYTLIDGHHRIKALKELCIKQAPAIVSSVKDEAEALLKSIKLNTERGQQNPKLLAQIIDEIRQNYDIERETIYDEPTIKDLLDLLTLDENNLENIKQRQEEEIDFVLYSFLVPKSYKEKLDSLINKFGSPRGLIEYICQRLE